MPLFNIKNMLSVASESVTQDDMEILNFASPNKYVSAKGALHNSDLYSAIFMLSSDLASMKLTADKPQVQSFLDNPSATSNGHAFWQSMYAQLLLSGEAFAYIWRNRNGMVSRLEYLRPSQVNTYLLDSGNGLVYTITFDEPKIGVKQYEPQSNVIHMRLLSTSGGMLGRSPLESLSDELKIKHLSNNLTTDALQKSIMSPGILKETKGGLLNAAMKAARSKQFMHQVTHSDGGPIVIDDLEEYTPLEIKSDLSKLLAQVDWTSAQIAKVYGIPSNYLGGKGDQQSSISMIQGAYANTLSRYANSAVSELDDKLVAHIEHNLRPSIDATGDSYANQIATLKKDGILDQNQAVWVLKEFGYLSADLPKPKPIKQPAAVPKQPENPEEGSDENGQESNSD